MGSFSLTAYKALARGTGASNNPAYPQRPEGPLIWAVVSNDKAAQSMVYLVQRLRALRGNCTLLLTYSEQAKVAVSLRRHELNCALPNDSVEDSRRFLDHWAPSLCLWVGGNLKPALVAETHARGIPLSLVAAQEELLDQPLWRWVPSLARETLASFGKITAQDEAAQRLLRKMVGTRREIELSGALQDAALAPPVNESVFEELSAELNGRSVWLASNVQADELSDVLDAHREAIRVTHRLLLVLVCASFPDAVEARKLLQKRGWRVCHWEDGEQVEENTQIILVEEPEEMGLWYRIAPLCFLGSSLRPGHGGCDPYVPASLGSAIIYGPNVGAHVSSYSRLAAAGAARIVKDAHGLERAVIQLLAPDQAAHMAHAAWETILEGAATTDEIIEDIQIQLDALEGDS